MILKSRKGIFDIIEDWESLFKNFQKILTILTHILTSAYLYKLKTENLTII